MIGTILKNLINDSSARKALLVVLPVLCISGIICILEYICNQLLKVIEKLHNWCDL